MVSGSFAAEAGSSASAMHLLDEMQPGEIGVFQQTAAFVAHNSAGMQLYVDGLAPYERGITYRFEPDQIVVGRLALREMYGQDTDQTTFLVDLGPHELTDLMHCRQGIDAFSHPVAAHTTPNRYFNRDERHSPGGAHFNAVKILMAHADGVMESGLHLPPRHRLGYQR